MTNDRRPQLRAISSNLCPNARRRAITEFSSCDLTAMTTWGYCTECWEQGRVPALWAASVDKEIDRLTGVNR
jgi:hypothetical protein